MPGDRDRAAGTAGSGRVRPAVPQSSRGGIAIGTEGGSGYRDGAGLKAYTFLRCLEWYARKNADDVGDYRPAAAISRKDVQRYGSCEQQALPRRVLVCGEPTRRQTLGLR